MRGEWNEELPRTESGGLRNASDAVGQCGCGCLGVLALIVVSFSFVYFLFGMTSVAYDAWGIVSHWLLIK